MSSKGSDAGDIEKRSIEQGVVAQADLVDEIHNQGLQRQLRNRHAQMITLGGVIGTGLFFGTSGSLANGGPVGMLLGYLVVSSVCVCVMISLGELITFLPIPGGQMTLAGRFVDPALSFSLGWNYWYSGIVSLPAELSGAALLINFWNDSINSAVWITMSLVIVIMINFLGTRVYGEAEFWFASIKLVAIVGLIILGIVIDLGGAPGHDRLGFRYWKNPGPFVQFNDIPGAKGRFLGFWSTLVGAAYAFLGTEVLGLTAAETRNPKKNIPLAIRGVYVRVLVFYILSVFILGLVCPSNNPNLTTDSGTADSSAWVIAVKIAGIKALPSIVNACFLTSAWSAGSSELFISSRVLFGLAKTGQAPAWLTKTNRYGTPWTSLIVCSVFTLLAYMGVSAGSSTVFGWFVNMSSVSGLLNWTGICITLIRFRKGLKAQGLSTDVLPYRSKFQPYAAYWGLAWSILITLFSDWDVFLAGNWDHATFITSYFGIFFFFLLYFGYKYFRKSKVVSLSEMDFVTHAIRA